MSIFWTYHDGCLTARNAANQCFRWLDDIPARGQFLASLLNSLPTLSRMLVPPFMLDADQAVAT